MLKSTMENQKKQMFNSSNNFNKFQTNYNFDEKPNFDTGDQANQYFNNNEMFNISILNKEKKQNQHSSTYHVDLEKNNDYEKPNINTNLHYNNVKIDKVNESN